MEVGNGFFVHHLVEAIAMAVSAKWEHLIFPFTVLSVSLLFLITNYLFFTVNYSRQPLQEEDLSGWKYPEWFESKHDETAAVPRRSSKWFQVVKRELGSDRIDIGVLNGDSTMNGDEEVHGNAKFVTVEFSPVRCGDDMIRWSDLAPERINKSSKCPAIPMPKFEEYPSLDVVLFWGSSSSSSSCKNGGTRDVYRLQVNLVMANLLARNGKMGSRPLYAVFFDLKPMWEIFKCDELVWNDGNAWIYKPDMNRIRELVQLPVGSCQFVPPFSSGDEESSFPLLPSDSSKEEAYVTVLHSSEDYVCGAIVLAQSIIFTNSSRDLVLLADDAISPDSIRALKLSGWKTMRIQRMRSPFSRNNAYNEWNYSKLRMWRLIRYKKLLFIDADLIVNRNCDGFFAYPQLTAAGNYQKHLFNSGLMVVEPSECTYRDLVREMMVVESYNGGDQGFLNEMFWWWHRLPAESNYLKVFVDPSDRLHWVNKDTVYAVHYTGLKPWKCLRDEDCNWDFDEFHRYASHSAQRLWINVFRKMPRALRDFCSAKKYENLTTTTTIESI
ncbi:plant glycogenin-like starch initiation protein 3 [Genlisea aurea]|uniref:Hexosyltransferase n=1 Tax=Genlisea aurea TaxID=192259 RepID=S8CT19_9LAMI|nr:plant glycogenin-like starch initiation protein 3 [Genlisea aurea]